MSNVIEQAREILEREKPGDIAARLGQKSTGNIYQLRNDKVKLTENMAARIVEAYEGKPLKAKKAATKKPAVKKPAEKPVGGKTGKDCFVPIDDHLNALEKHEYMGEITRIARAAVSKVSREELIPALNEKVPVMVEKLVDKRLAELGLLPGKAGSRLVRREKPVEPPPEIEESAYPEESVPLEEQPEKAPPIEPDPAEPDTTVAPPEFDLVAEGAEPPQPKKRRFWRKPK